MKEDILKILNNCTCSISFSFFPHFFLFSLSLYILWRHMRGFLRCVLGQIVPFMVNRYSYERAEKCSTFLFTHGNLQEILCPWGSYTCPSYTCPSYTWTLLALSFSPAGSMSLVWLCPAPPSPGCRYQLLVAAGTQLWQALRGFLTRKAWPRLSELVIVAQATHKVLQSSALETGVSEGMFRRV